MAIEDFESKLERGVLSAPGRTDDVATTVLYPSLQRSAVIEGNKMGQIPRVMEPLRSIVERLGYRFREFTGESIEQMARRGRVQIHFNNLSGRESFLYTSGRRREVAFHRDADCVLLPETERKLKPLQDFLRAQHFRGIFGISRVLMISDMSARDLVELGIVYREITGRSLYDENSGLSTTTAGQRRVCVGRYGRDRCEILTIHSVPQEKGLRDVLGAFAMELTPNITTGEAISRGSGLYQ